LDLFVDDHAVANGGIAAELDDVPMYNVIWDPGMAGSGIANEVGLVTLDYRLAADVGDISHVFRFGVDGADDQYLALIDAFPGGSAIVDFYCTPTGPGDYELTVTAGWVNHPGNTVAKVRCHGVDDYAFIKGRLFDTFAQHDSMRFYGGPVYQHSTHSYTEMEPGSTIQTSVTAPDGTLADDGKTFVYVDPGVVLENDSTKYYVYLVDIETGDITPVLAADEVTQYVNAFYGVGRALINADATAVAILSPSAIIIKDLQSNTVESVPFSTGATPDQEPALSAGIFAFSADGSRLFYGEKTTTNFFNYEDLYVYDRATAMAEPLGLTAPTGVAANRFATNDAMDLFVLGMANQGSYEFAWYDRSAGTTKPLFEGALEHLATLHGRPGSIAIPDTPAISPDGKYAAVSINSWSDTSYWGGQKGAYVEEIATGKLWSVGAMSDGTQLSGDGWSLGAIEVADDGAYAIVSLLWSSGGLEGLSNDIGQDIIILPRRLWLEVN
jgi:hypothetical protein